MNKILITGASGTVGTQLVKTLRAQGIDFDILRSSAGASQGTRVASYTDSAALRSAFAGVDTLFVLLPLVPNKVELATNVANAAVAAGVKHIVRSSGAGADPQSPFALSRMQGEIDQIFSNTGIATTFLRPAGFMQNYANMMAGMVKTGTLFAASANAPQSLIDVRDIAAVAATILMQPQHHAGKAYTLTGGEALTDSERAAVLSEVLRRTVNFVAVSREAGRAALEQRGLPASVVEWLDSLNAVVAAGYAAAISPDVEALLGRPAIRFREFAVDYKEAWL